MKYRQLAWGFESSLVPEWCVLFDTILSVSYATDVDNCGLDSVCPKGDITRRAVQHSLKCSCLVLS